MKSVECMTIKMAITLMTTSFEIFAARYYAVNMAMIVLTLVVTALVSTLLKRGAYELPVSDSIISVSI